MFHPSSGGAPSPLALEKTLMSHLAVTRARMVQRPEYAFRCSMGTMCGGASLRTTAVLFALEISQDSAQRL